MPARENATSKIAVVTGAGSGIGRALAQALHAKGYRLALCDIDARALEETAAPLDAMTRAFDVANRAEMEAFAAAVLEKFGHADMVFNNAGVSLAQPISEVSCADFEWLFGINFWGTVYGTKAFLPSMLARGRGDIVNISSIFGIVAWPCHGTYSAAKFAVRGFTEALQHELAQIPGGSVRAFCVYPAGIKTNIVRNSRFFKDSMGSDTKEKSVAVFESVAKVTPADAAARILRGVELGRPRILVGGDAYGMSLLARLFPVRHLAVIRAIRRWTRPAPR